jgi:hypothetical protein
LDSINRLVAVLISLLVVILPIVAFKSLSGLASKLPQAGCAATCVLLPGYPFAILAHYRLLFSKTRTGPRKTQNPPSVCSLSLHLSFLVWQHSWREAKFNEN